MASNPLFDRFLKALNRAWTAVLRCMHSTEFMVQRVMCTPSIPKPLSLLVPGSRARPGGNRGRVQRPMLMPLNRSPTSTVRELLSYGTKFCVQIYGAQRPHYVLNTESDDYAIYARSSSATSGTPSHNISHFYTSNTSILHLHHALLLHNDPPWYFRAAHASNEEMYSPLKPR